MQTIEFRVRPVTRYNLTYYFEDGRTGSSMQIGEFDSLEAAEKVAKAMHAQTPNSALVLPDSGQRLGGTIADKFRNPYIGSVAQANNGVAHRMTEAGWVPVQGPITHGSGTIG